MKYIKLYEAFSSNTLSKLYAHLKKKNATRKSLVQFKSDLETIAKSLDIPMDRISDEDVSYIQRRKALGLRSEENVQNRFGIWAIKFWFDKDGEYIGSSGTGNKVLKDQQIPRFAKQSKPFTKEQMAYLRSFQKTGMLKPVLEGEYGNLKSKDLVFAVICDPDYYEDELVDNLTKGRIFVDCDGCVYISHDNSDAEGIEPGDSPSDEYPEIEWGEYFWKISDQSKRPVTDHFNLYKLIESDEPLGYYSEGSGKESGGDSFEFNLCLEEEEDGLGLTSWFENMDEKKRIEKDADFAVMLYVDDILSRGMKSVKETGAERKEARKGATALMTDYEFRNANIEKYLNRIVQMIGVTPESVELKSLEKAVAAILSSGTTESYSLLAILGQAHKEVEEFAYQIKRLVSGASVSDDKDIFAFVYGQFSKEYKRMREEASSLYVDRKRVMSVIGEDTRLRPLHDAIARISRKITNSILSREIVKGEDLTKLCFKIKSIHEMMSHPDFKLSYDFEGLFRFMRQPDRMREEIESIENEAISSDLKRLAHIESYVDDIMR